MVPFRWKKVPILASSSITEIADRRVPLAPGGYTRIKAAIVELPTYGYQRIHAILKRFPEDPLSESLVRVNLVVMCDPRRQLTQHRFFDCGHRFRPATHCEQDRQKLPELVRNRSVIGEQRHSKFVVQTDADNRGT
jgi:hypothetical protein